MAGLLDWMKQMGGAVDPRTSPYFGGDPNAASRSTLGNGDGTGYYSGLPDAVFDVFPQGEGEPIRRINQDKLQQWLGSNELMEANQPGTSARWLQDPSGQVAGPVDEIDTDDSRFMTAAMIAAGVTGANVLGAQGGLGGFQGGGEAGLKSFAPMPPSAYDPTVISSLASQGLGPVDMAFPELLQAGAGGLGTLAGANSMPMPPAQQAPLPTGTTPPVSMPTIPPSVSLPGGGGGLLDSVLKYAPVVAGAIGGSQPSGGGETTRQSKMDPRMDPYVYDSYLPALKAQYEKGKTPNENQRKGWDMQLGLLTDPVRMKQLQDMQAAAMARSQSPIAGNPFSNGGATLYQSRRGLLGGG